MNIHGYCAIGLASVIIASAAWAQPGTPANSVVNYPGAGVIQAGDVSESFLPQGTTPYYGEAVTASVYAHFSVWGTLTATGQPPQRTSLRRFL
jgi:hypothetical protein